MEERLQNTTWEPLCGGARVLVSPQHAFGTDAVLLAHFAAPPPGGALGGPGHRLRGDSPAVAGAHPGRGHHRGGDCRRRPPGRPERSVAENGFSATVGIVRGDARRLAGAVPGGQPGRHRLQPTLHRAGSGHPQRGWRPPRRPPGGQPLFGGCGPGGQVRPALWGQALPVLAAPAAGRGRGDIPQPPAGAQAAAAGAATGGESALFVFAGVPPGRQARHGGGPGAPAGAGGRQPHPGNRGHLRRLPGQPGAQKQ